MAHTCTMLLRNYSESEETEKNKDKVFTYTYSLSLVLRHCAYLLLYCFNQYYCDSIYVRLLVWDRFSVDVWVQDEPSTVH